MKIAEALSIIKQLEGELQRLVKQRKTLSPKSKDEKFYDGLTREQILVEEIKDKEQLIEKFETLTKEIKRVQLEIISLKNKVNIKNIETGIDLKLITMKALSAELTRLNDLEDGGIFGYSFKKDTRAIFDIPKRIKDLESEKNTLDKEIQYINWTTEI